ncbi:hypothetical protein BV898_19811 [Hypsibius exemplaris]|uniref:Uncharacterized protein n=1 Tax=Hypsibius exemplaris TaxID=2072580 RepID=A0A9X6NLJ0_HYPEX|nr:hypothetical protein BV898_19811 [Hypsibius exemplaris]
MAVIAAMTMLINWRALGRRIKKALHSAFPTWIQEPKDRGYSSESSSLLDSAEEDQDNIFQPPTEVTGALNSDDKRPASYGTAVSLRTRTTSAGFSDITPASPLVLF